MLRLAALLMLVGGNARAEGKIYVTGGEVMGEAAPSSVAGAWWAICGDQLRKVEARVVVHRDSDGKPTGFRSVETPGCDNPPLLLRDFPFLRARKLERKGAKIEHLVDKHHYRVKYEGKVIFDRPLVAEQSQDVQGTEVVWAGDLDGDGKRDLVLDLRYHEAGTIRALFLSTAGAPVREVARLELPGC